MFCTCFREERLRAKGLDPDEIEGEDKPTSRPLPEMKLVPPPSRGEGGTNGSTSRGTSSTTLPQTKGGVASNVKPQTVVIDDKELPSSTPAPPPLNVPIVTHSARPSEGMIQEILFCVCVCELSYDPILSKHHS